MSLVTGLGLYASASLVDSGMTCAGFWNNADCDRAIEPCVCAEMTLPDLGFAGVGAAAGVGLLSSSSFSSSTDSVACC